MSNGIETFEDIELQLKSGPAAFIGSKARRQLQYRVFGPEEETGRGWVRACRNARSHDSGRSKAEDWFSKTYPSLVSWLRELEEGYPEVTRVAQLYLASIDLQPDHVPSGQILDNTIEKLWTDKLKPLYSPGFVRLVWEDVWNPPSRESPASSTSVNALLVSCGEAAGRFEMDSGVVAELKVWAIQGELRDIYPVARYSMVPLDEVFKNSITTARHHLIEAQIWKKPIDIGWELRRLDAKPTLAFSGPSAGAAFGMAMGKLLSFL